MIFLAMRNPMHILLPALALFLPAAFLHAVPPPVTWDVGKVVSVMKGNALEITVDYIIIGEHVRSGFAVLLRSYAECGGKKVPLTPVMIAGDGGRPDVPVPCLCIRSGASPGRASTSDRVRLPDGDSLSVWTEVSEVSSSSSGKGRRLELRRIACGGREPCPGFYPLLEPVMPDFDAAAPRRTVIPLTIEYRTGTDAAIDEDRGRNYLSLSSFRRQCIALVTDERVEVSSVSLSAWTDVRGGDEDNRKLSEKRLEKLYSRLGGRKTFGKTEVSRSGEGEDWPSVLRWVESSIWGRDARLTGLLSRDMDADQREVALKRDFPQVWEAMKEGLFPGLGRFECVIEYTVQPLVSAEEIRLAYRDNERILSPADFYRLSSSFRWGGPEWRDVFLDCVRLYPDDEAANMNAVTAMLASGFVREAGKHLRACGSSPRARYLEAVWQVYMGSPEAACDTFRSLCGTVPEAEDALRKAERIAAWRRGECGWRLRTCSIGDGA